MHLCIVVRTSWKPQSSISYSSPTSFLPFLTFPIPHSSHTSLLYLTLLALHSPSFLSLFLVLPLTPFLPYLTPQPIIVHVPLSACNLLPTFSFSFTPPIQCLCPPIIPFALISLPKPHYSLASLLQYMNHTPLLLHPSFTFLETKTNFTIMMSHTEWVLLFLWQSCGCCSSNYLQCFFFLHCFCSLYICSNSFQKWHFRCQIRNCKGKVKKLKLWNAEPTVHVQLLAL